MATRLHDGRVAPPETPDDDPRIANLMTARVVAVTPDAPLHAALRLMAVADVRRLPVLDGERGLGRVGRTEGAAGPRSRRHGSLGTASGPAGSATVGP